MRNLSLDLRPSLLDDLGLIPALRWYLKRQAVRVGFAARFVAEPEEMHLPPELEITCFRVAQEALTNVARHAAAGHTSVEVRRHEAALEFEDDAPLASVANGGTVCYYVRILLPENHAAWSSPIWFLVV